MVEPHATSGLFSEVRLVGDVGGGRGVFALTRLTAGSMIIAERPFVLWKDGTDFSDTDDLSTAVLQVFRSSDALQCSRQLYPQTVADCDADELSEVRALFEQYHDNDLHKLASACGASVEETLRVALTLQHNGFSSGLYEKQSMLNHSCTPNCLKLIPASKHGCSEIWTVRDIEQGEELSICYVNPLESSSTSIREYLWRNHKFHCLCPKCASRPDDLNLTGSGDPDALLLLEKEIQRTEAELSDLGDAARKGDGAACAALLAQLAAQTQLCEDAATAQPSLYAPLLARLHKAEVSAVVKQIWLCERHSLALSAESAAAYVQHNVALLAQQQLYLPALHPDLAATLSDLSDAILALKQQFSNTLSASFDAGVWDTIVSSLGPHADAGATRPPTTAAQCAKACTARAKHIKAMYSTAVRCPLALRLLSAPPGAFCWGGSSENGGACGELGGLGEQHAVDEDELDFF